MVTEPKTKINHLARKPAVVFELKLFVWRKIAGKKNRLYQAVVG
jgi:hypothetical protein